MGTIKAKVGVFSTLLLVSFLSVATSVISTAAVDVIEVPRDYSTIQEAINAANDGDTVRVAAGTYFEQITVNKSLTLIGENRKTTIINGLSLTVVTITANYVNMSGFTVKNGTSGIELLSNGNNITNNIMTSNAYEGIYAESCSGNTIAGNVILENDWGIGLDSSFVNTIANNTIALNTFEGVYLSASSGNNIVDNRIANNSIGITLSSSDSSSSDSNTIVGNTISFSKEIGIAIDSSSGNKIYHNNFVDNSQQVSSYNSVSTWDDGYPSGGNYWSDYTVRYPDAQELSDSGIWNTPYVIDADNKDNYPLMDPWSPAPDSTPPTTIHDYDGSWRADDFRINLTAIDDISGVQATYYKINNDSPPKNVQTDGQPFITEEGANNTLEYWSVDKTGNVESHFVLTDIKLDKTPPTVSILSPSNGSEIGSSSVSVNWTGADSGSGIDHYEVRLDDRSWIKVTGQTYIFNFVGDGSHTVVVKAVDKAGWSRETSVSFVVNTRPIGGNGYLEEAAVVVIVVAVVVVVAFLYIFKRRKKAEA